MSGARWLSVLFVLLAPAAARAQLVGMNIELFGTVGVVGGVTPVQVASGSHLDSHAGIRLDGGVQIARFGLGAGLRYWEMTPTEEYGGRGMDVFILGEWRPGKSLRTTVRASYGIGFDDIDSGHSQASPTISTNGDVWSVGVGHEVIVFSGARFILSADLLMPANPGAIGRRRPVFEIGLGFRFREFQAIVPLSRRQPF